MRLARGFGVALVLALTDGCMTIPQPRVKTLLAHPEFPDAARAAPSFTRDALKAVADLEAALKTSK